VFFKPDQIGSSFSFQVVAKSANSSMTFQAISVANQTINGNTSTGAPTIAARFEALQDPAK
jgi:hypothetical protein